MFAIGTYNIGSGDCFNEEVRIFVGDTKEEIVRNFEEHKRICHSGWNSYLEFEDELVFEVDKSAHVSSRYA